MRRLAVALALALAVAVSPVPGHAAAPTSDEWATAEVSTFRYSTGDGGTLLVAICQVHATGRPANTGAYCRLDNLPYVMAMYPNSPHAVKVFCGAATAPFVVCAGGEVWWRNGAPEAVPEQCRWFETHQGPAVGGAAVSPLACGVS